MPEFRKPIRIHTQGFGADLLLTDFGGSCGDIRGRDCIGVIFEGERAGFVLSMADLEQAVRAIEIERQHADEERHRNGSSRSEGTARD